MKPAKYILCLVVKSLGGERTMRMSPKGELWGSFPWRRLAEKKSPYMTSPITNWLPMQEMMHAPRTDR